MWDESVRRAFEKLEGQANAHARGPQFEVLVQRLFEREHFTVKRNPGIARPRQTDLLATYGDETYLIETKWQQAQIDINDIDSLRSRLQRTSGHVIGVLFSMSGFTTTAIEQITTYRDRTILLFGEQEIRHLFANQASLIPLLRRKRETFLTDGQVLLDIADHSWRGTVLNPNDLPLPQVQILDGTGTELPWITAEGGFAEAVFVDELPDVNWTPAQGIGVGLDLVLPIQSRNDLPYVFELLRSVGWISSAGHWAIEQSDVCWYGMGARSFLDAVDHWELRYQATQAHYHHSEHATYFDVSDGGFYTLSMNMRASERGNLLYPHLSVQLQGIPLHPEPFRRLARSFDRDDQVYFRSLTTDANIQQLPRSKERIRLEPVAFLCRTTTGEDIDTRGWVTGIVVKNPFRGKRLHVKRTKTRVHIPEALDSSALLVCSLRSWHELTDHIDYYYLWSFEFLHMYHAAILHPVADWESEQIDSRVWNLR